VAGDRVRFVRGRPDAGPSDSAGLTTTYDRLIDELHPGDRVVLADGTVSLLVESVERNAATCRVTQGGTVRSGQGVNLPGVKLTVPALSEEDRDRAAWAAAAGVEYIGLSFVRREEEVHELKGLIASAGGHTDVIAKIEKPEAVENLESIVRAADGVMVARGDLGVEIDIAEMPIVQKRIIAICRRYCKPVIVATQMLDSMQHSRLPTRAEATDVANAILDGADACMLSGETAIGRFPRESVEMMHRIAVATESVAEPTTVRSAVAEVAEGINPITHATCSAAGELAERLGAKLLLVATATGTTARVLSKQRWSVPVIGVSDDETTRRKLCLYWGVVPVDGAPVAERQAVLDFVESEGRATGQLGPGDRIVVLSGLGTSTSRHNMVLVHEVE